MAKAIESPGRGPPRKQPHQSVHRRHRRMACGLRQRSRPLVSRWRPESSTGPRRRWGRSRVPGAGSPPPPPGRRAADSVLRSPRNARRRLVPHRSTLRPERATPLLRGAWVLSATPGDRGHHQEASPPQDPGRSYRAAGGTRSITSGRWSLAREVSPLRISTAPALSRSPSSRTKARSTRDAEALSMRA